MNTMTRLGLGPLGQLEVRPARGDSVPTLVLPPACASGGLPLMEALLQRRSQREFATAPLPEQMLGDLLWAACGVNRPAHRAEGDELPGDRCLRGLVRRPVS